MVAIVTVVLHYIEVFVLYSPAASLFYRVATVINYLTPFLIHVFSKYETVYFAGIIPSIRLNCVINGKENKNFINILNNTQRIGRYLRL